jgi:type II secretory pathway pseudopilin PulG
MVRTRTARDAERGETLVEVMMTVVVVGVAFVAVLGAIWTAIRVSDYHRKTSTADVLLRNFAEQMKQATGPYQYKPCATLTGADAYPAYPVSVAHYAASITQIEYFTGVNGSGVPQWSGTCSTDRGAQRLKLKVTGPTDSDVTGTETVTIVKRDARAG